jgi:CoA:oxalate CoA-transferase
VKRNADKPFALADLRVLDLSRAIAGPFVGRLLADLGADVVKVEPPEGDISRKFGIEKEGVTGLFLQQNAGKRNVCIDLKDARGAALASALAARADVVIENYRPGVLDRLGLGWEKLSGLNPRLVMLSITGFGSDGSAAQRPAYAPVIHAESGWIARRAAMYDGTHQDAAMSFADSITSLHGMVALMAALRLRDQTGVGQRVEVAMLDSWLVTDDYVHWALDGVATPGPQGGEIWEAPGGPVMVNQHLAMFWKTLSDAYGLRSDEPSGADVAAKVIHRRAAIARWMVSFPTRGELIQALEKVHVAWGDVRSGMQVLESPAVTERGVVTEVDDGVGGKRRLIDTPYRFSAAAAGVRAGASRAGAHNRETLSDWLALGGAALDELERAGVLRADPGRATRND